MIQVSYFSSMANLCKTINNYLNPNRQPSAKKKKKANGLFLQALIKELIKYIKF